MTKTLETRLYHCRSPPASPNCRNGLGCPGLRFCPARLDGLPCGVAEFLGGHIRRPVAPADLAATSA